VRASRVQFRSADKFIVAGNGDDSGQVTHRALTPVAGVLWRVTERTQAYVTAGRGFETPTFNELAYRPAGGTGLNFSLQPAKSRQWEIGVKSSLLPGVQGTAALFEARTQNEITVQTNTGGRSTFQNAGQTSRKGLELGVSGQWRNGLHASLAFTALNATYRTAFLTCTVAPCAAPNVLVAAGNRLPGIPRTTLFAELGWRHKPSGFHIAADIKRTASIWVDDRNSDSAAAYTVANLHGGFEQRWNGWQFKQFVRVDNLFNRGYAGSVIVNEANGRYFEGAPKRNWLLGLSVGYAWQ
jgi:iron complex outermembrane recepter protein